MRLQLLRLATFSVIWSVLHQTFASGVDPAAAAAAGATDANTHGDLNDNNPAADDRELFAIQGPPAVARHYNDNGATPRHQRMHARAMVDNKVMTMMMMTSKSSSSKKVSKTNMVTMMEMNVFRPMMMMMMDKEYHKVVDQGRDMNMKGNFIMNMKGNDMSMSMMKGKYIMSMKSHYAMMSKSMKVKVVQVTKGLGQGLKKNERMFFSKGKGFRQRYFPKPPPRPRPGRPSNPSFPTRPPTRGGLTTQSPTEAPTIESVCVDTEPSTFSESLLFDFEGPVGLVNQEDIALLEMVLLDAYNTVAQCDAPGAFIRADSVQIQVDAADSFGDNIGTNNPTRLEYTWLVTFSGTCLGCPADADPALFGTGDNSGTVDECVCDFPTTEAYVLECNERLQNLGSNQVSLTLNRVTTILAPTMGGGVPRTDFNSSITVTGSGSLFASAGVGGRATWGTWFLETYNSLNFWNAVLCDAEGRIITNIEPTEPVAADPSNPALFSIVFNIQGTCRGCPSETVIFGSHEATPTETGASCPAGALLRCPTSQEFQKALQNVIERESPGGANVTQVSISLEQQDQYITCVAVIDETDGFPPRSVQNLWTQLRTEFPLRPFCLLQPLRNDNLRVYTPPALLTDPNTIFANVTRDDNVVTMRSNWYDICNIDSSLLRGLTRVALFIDNSGSMTTSTVQASNDFFLERLASVGISDVRGVQNDNEDYISPCLTTTVE